MQLFEYGCGSSTLFFSKHVGTVKSVEHTEEWLKKIEPLAPDNTTIRHVPLSDKGEYASYISQFPQDFDIIVVDGRMRNDCIRCAVGKLKSDGIIILDDSDRESYHQGIDLLISNEFKRIDFCGLGPLGTMPHQTSVFYKPNNVLGI